MTEEFIDEGRLERCQPILRHTDHPGVPID